MSERPPKPRAPRQSLMRRMGKALAFTGVLLTGGTATKGMISPAKADTYAVTAAASYTGSELKQVLTGDNGKVKSEESIYPNGVNPTSIVFNKKDMYVAHDGEEGDAEDAIVKVQPDGTVLDQDRFPTENPSDLVVNENGVMASLGTKALKINITDPTTGISEMVDMGQDAVFDLVASGKDFFVTTGEIKTKTYKLIHICQNTTDNQWEIMGEVDLKSEYSPESMVAVGGKIYLMDDDIREFDAGTMTEAEEQAITVPKEVNNFMRYSTASPKSPFLVSVGFNADSGLNIADRTTHQYVGNASFPTDPSDILEYGVIDNLAFTPNGKAVLVNLHHSMIEGIGWRVQVDLSDPDNITSDVVRDENGDPLNVYATTMAISPDDNGDGTPDALEPKVNPPPFENLDLDLASDSDKDGLADYTQDNDGVGENGEYNTPLYISDNPDDLKILGKEGGNPGSISVNADPDGGFTITAEIGADFTLVDTLDPLKSPIIIDIPKGALLEGTVYDGAISGTDAEGNIIFMASGDENPEFKLEGVAAVGVDGTIVTFKLEENPKPGEDTGGTQVETDDVDAGSTEPDGDSGSGSPDGGGGTDNDGTANPGPDGNTPPDNGETPEPEGDGTPKRDNLNEPPDEDATGGAETPSSIGKAPAAGCESTRNPSPKTVAGIVALFGAVIISTLRGRRR